MQHHINTKGRTKEGNEASIASLEEQIDALNTEENDYEQRMEDLCNQMAELEDTDGDEYEHQTESRAHDALSFFNVPLSSFSIPTSQLSGGIRKKIALASILMERQSLILLDEPT